MNLKGLASILIVTRNNKDIIERNLQSVFRQSYKNIEVVIVDSSDDDSPLTIERCIEKYNSKNFEVKHIRTEAKGVGTARNTAIKSSSGEYIFFVDADCYISKDYVKHALKIFSQDDRILSIYINNRYYPREKGMFARVINLYEHSRRPTPSIDHFEFWVCRKKVFDLVGLFDANLEAGEDIEWWLRSKKLYKGLKKHGYKTVTASYLVMHEEKQAWSFREYWRKSMWYGEKFANRNYLKRNLITSIIEIVFILTQVMYPVTLIFFFLLNSHTNYLFITYTFVFFVPTLYILYRASIRRIISITFLLMPLLIFYKSVFLISGALNKAYKNIRQCI